MRLNHPLLIVVLALTIAMPSGAQVRKYSNAFLDIGIGARGLAMSNASVATVSDATSGFWNPAAMTRLTSNINVSLMHSEHFAGISKHDFGGVVVPFKDKQRFIGISMIRLGTDDIHQTLGVNFFNADGSINYDNIKSFSVADWAFLLSYAQKINKIKGLSVGGNVKIIYRNAGSFATAWGFGLDFSAIYDLKQWRLGVMAKDVTGTFNAWSFSFTEEEKQELVATGNIVPANSLEVTVPKFIFAAAYEVNIKDKFRILPELDFEMTTDGDRPFMPLRTNAVTFDPRFGLELNYLNIIYVRGGIGNFQTPTDETGEKVVTFQPTIGVGLKIKTFGLDYAFTDIGDQSYALYSHVISLSLGVNKKKP